MVLTLELTQKSQAKVAIFAPHNSNNDVNRIEIIQDHYLSMRQLYWSRCFADTVFTSRLMQLRRENLQTQNICKFKQGCLT